MTDRNELLRLAERVEAAPAEDQRDMLTLAFEAMRGPIRTEVNGIIRWNRHWSRFRKMLDAEAYESAAMTLLGEGSEIDLTNLYGVARAHVNMNDQHGGSYGNHEGGNLTLALTAAALRAIAQEDGR